MLFCTRLYTVPGTSNGLYGQASIAACRPCSPGSYAPFPMLAACIPCPAGTYMSQVGWSGASCTACPVNHYQGATGQANASACQRCPSGSFSPEGNPFASGCAAPPPLTCPPGQAPSSDRSVCVATACAAGFYLTFPSLTAAANCTPCVAGSFGGSSDVFNCATCPAGM